MCFQNRFNSRALAYNQDLLVTKYVVFRDTSFFWVCIREAGRGVGGPLPTQQASAAPFFPHSVPLFHCSLPNHFHLAKRYSSALAIVARTTMDTS